MNWKSKLKLIKLGWLSKYHFFNLYIYFFATHIQKRIRTLILKIYNMRQDIQLKY